MGCRAYCQCARSADGWSCAFCCKQENGYCYRNGAPSAPATALHGYKSQSCLRCAATSIGDGVCNGECNHADCDYDGGDCCGATTDDAYPKVKEQNRTGQVGFRARSSNSPQPFCSRARKLSTCFFLRFHV